MNDRQFSVTIKDVVILALLLVLAFVLWSTHQPKAPVSSQSNYPSSSYSHKSYSGGSGSGYSNGNSYSSNKSYSSKSKPATCYDGDYTNDYNEC